VVVSEVKFSGTACCKKNRQDWAGLSTDLLIEQVMMQSIKSAGGLTHGRGMNESVRIMWVKTLHRLASISSALGSLASLDNNEDNLKHCEMGRSRMTRDWSDLQKVVAFFECHNPFAVSDQALRSLSTGHIASDDDRITCDSAEDVGLKIMSDMDNKSYNDAVIKKSDLVRTMADIQGRNVCVGKKLPWNSKILFSRLLAVAQRHPDVQSLFAYELTTYPSSLFSAPSVMRKTAKSVLAREITKNVVETEIHLSATSFVIDGGWLLHKVKWQAGGIYADVLRQYVQYVSRNYGRNAVIVFDGYGNGPSTKYHEHDIRASKCAPDVAFNDHLPSYSNQAAFLANENNKKVLVDHLKTEYESSGFSVFQAEHDADMLIVSKSLEFANHGVPVNVVANDTDILIMLVHHFRSTMADILVMSEAGRRTSGKTVARSVGEICATVSDISSLVDRLSPPVRLTYVSQLVSFPATSAVPCCCGTEECHRRSQPVLGGTLQECRHRESLETPGRFLECVRETGEEFV